MGAASWHNGVQTIRRWPATYAVIAIESLAPKERNATHG